MMMFYSLMMPAQNVFQRKKYQSYILFSLFLGHFTGESAFQNLVILAGCITSSG